MPTVSENGPNDIPRPGTARNFRSGWSTTPPDRTIHGGMVRRCVSVRLGIYHSVPPSRTSSTKLAAPPPVRIIIRKGSKGPKPSPFVSTWHGRDSPNPTSKPTSKPTLTGTTYTDRYVRGRSNGSVVKSIEDVIRTLSHVFLKEIDDLTFPFFSNISPSRLFCPFCLPCIWIHYIHVSLPPQIQDIRKTYKFQPSCQKSVPESIIAFLEGTDPVIYPVMSCHVMSYIITPKRSQLQSLSFYFSFDYLNCNRKCNGTRYVNIYRDEL